MASAVGPPFGKRPRAASGLWALLPPGCRWAGTGPRPRWWWWLGRVRSAVVRRPPPAASRQTTHGPPRLHLRRPGPRVRGPCPPPPPRPAWPRRGVAGGSGRGRVARARPRPGDACPGGDPRDAAASSAAARAFPRAAVAPRPASCPPPSRSVVDVGGRTAWSSRGCVEEVWRWRLEGWRGSGAWGKRGCGSRWGRAWKEAGAEGAAVGGRPPGFLPPPPLPSTPPAALSRPLLLSLPRAPPAVVSSPPLRDDGRRAAALGVVRFPAPPPLRAARPSVRPVAAGSCSRPDPPARASFLSPPFARRGRRG